jgi:hypothetical protein
MKKKYGKREMIEETELHCVALSHLQCKVINKVAHTALPRAAVSLLIFFSKKIAVVF